LHEDKVKKALGILDEARLIAIMPLGNLAEKKELLTERKPWVKLSTANASETQKRQRITVQAFNMTFNAELKGKLQSRIFASFFGC